MAAKEVLARGEIAGAGALRLEHGDVVGRQRNETASLSMNAFRIQVLLAGR